MAKVELFVSGRIYDGWKDVDISRALTAISGSFSLSITDRWSGQNEPWVVSPDDACEVKIDGQTVITGYVFEVTNSFDKATRTIGAAGRDKTADFVDCSVDLGYSEIANVSLIRLAQILAAPFGISVAIDGSPGAVFNKFTFNIGETCFEALERAARLRGFLLTTDGVGGILITRPGSTRSSTILEQGKNILQAGSTYDHTDRFSKYKVKAQLDSLQAALASTSDFQVLGQATDPNVRRNRPMVLSAEGSADNGAAKTRAQWEATTRAAKASKFRVQVQGWQQGDGSLWRVNQLVRLRSPWLGIDDDLLVVATKMTLSAQAGTLTELQLERKDAYKPEPTVPEKTDPLESSLRKAVAGG